jgi:soluble lytic murein transglycosylase-like protein
MKRIIAKFTITLIILFTSFCGVAGNDGSDKTFIIYGNNAYNINDFKKGLVLGVDFKYRPLLSRYLENILILSEKYKIDPVLVVSTIWVESAFNHKAKSNCGALGLMQIMPKTNTWIFKTILKKHPDAVLSKEENNIEAGIGYLTHLKKKFGGNEEKMLIAYNMGPRYVINKTDGKFDHQYYKRITAKFDQISKILLKKKAGMIVPDFAKTNI